MYVFIYLFYKECTRTLKSKIAFPVKDTCGAALRFCQNLLTETPYSILAAKYQRINDKKVINRLSDII